MEMEQERLNDVGEVLVNELIKENTKSLMSIMESVNELNNPEKYSKTNILINVITGTLMVIASQVFNTKELQDYFLDNHITAMKINFKSLNNG
jgi:hypothetical protein